MENLLYECTIEVARGNLRPAVHKPGEYLCHFFNQKVLLFPEAQARFLSEVCQLFHFVLIQKPALNAEIVGLLARRVEVARGIGEAKRDLGLPIVDRAREEKVYERARELAREAGLDPECVVRVFSEIVDLSTKAQEDGR